MVMEEAKHLHMPRTFTLGDVILFLLAGCLIGAILGSQGTRWQMRHEEQARQTAAAEAKLQDIHGSYDAAADLDAPARGRASARRLVRRITP